MKKKEHLSSEALPIREAVERPSQEASLSVPPIKTKVPMRCQDCRAEAAFHAWSAEPLPVGAVSCSIVLTEHVDIPPGKRAVIELVTATISVGSGERALLRLYTSLGHSPSNLDLSLVLQGEFQGLERLVATHALRVYSDHLVEFGVARSSTATEGYAIVCVSGYFVNV